MTASSKISSGAFFVKLAGSGFSLIRMQAKDIQVQRGDSPTDALSRFEAQINSTTCPPGPKDTWLGEVVIHSTDIRRPLGIDHTFPPEVLVAVADFYKGSNLVIGAKKRVEGVALKATDVDWSHGTGPEASGPLLSIVMAMSGRKAALADLSGDGVATLQSRD
jgi:uncharacterized protein (TIGR03083 family)